MAARQAGDPEANQALGELCGVYWYPIYAFIRRMGNSTSDAEDLTQEFFTRFLEKHHVVQADPEKGRFRSFLLTSVKHFIADQEDRRLAKRRGGRANAVPLNIEDAEKWYGRQFSTAETPELLFEREWAFTLIRRASDRMALAFAREGRSDYFNHLKAFLPGNHAPDTIAEVANRLGMSESAVKVAVHRLRHRFGETFRAEISLLVSDPELVNDEIRNLLNVLRN
ncbi:MAG: RNA polymerase sigma factor [Bryobacteraceae bacterium]